MLLPLALFLLFAIPQSVPSQDENELDLTKAPPPQSEPGAGRVWAGGIANSDAPKLPLEVTLLNVNAEHYRLGDTIAYEVRLKNSGKQSVTIPWSGDRSLRPDTPEEAKLRGYVDLRICLSVADRAGDRYLMAGQTVHGLSGLEYTFKTIAPGESVVIRAKGPLSLQPQEVTRVLPDSTSDVELFASVNLLPYRLTNSGNRIVVRLSRAP
jgi:hypothetical protein